MYLNLHGLLHQHAFCLRRKSIFHVQRNIRETMHPRMILSRRIRNNRLHADAIAMQDDPEGAESLHSLVRDSSLAILFAKRNMIYVREQWLQTHKIMWVTQMFIHNLQRSMDLDLECKIVDW